MKSSVVYKILSAADWAAAQRNGLIEGSALDRVDGYIHLSSDAQTPETLARHFAGMTGLVLVAFDGPTLGAALKWEPSRSGDLFPHFYGTLFLTHALWSASLPLDDAGVHILPDAMS